jgi:hypothetical protein
MTSRPRAGRGMTGRDGKESDLENEMLSRALESLRKAQGFNDHCRRLGQEIVALEEEIKSIGRTLAPFVCLLACDTVLSKGRRVVLYSIRPLPPILRTSVLVD